MKSKTIITLARLAAGTAILITSMVTGVNGTTQSIALVLMAVPVEVLAKDEKPSA